MLTLLLITVYSATPCGSGPECVHGDCTYGDGAYFCQCRRGWAGAACDAPRAGFLKIPASGRAASDRAVNYACLVNGTECTGSSKCNYYAGAYSCDPCPAGFVSYEDECLPKSCFNNGDYNNQEASKPPCNGRGRCLLKDPGMAGLSADEYACDCYPIYRGALCESCNDANAIAVSNTPSRALPTCNARACQDADGVVCSGHGKCVLDVGLDRESYHYRCNCESEYTRVGHKCVKTECVATVDGSPVVCGGFGECTEDKDNAGTFRCVCDSNAVQVDTVCTYSACTDSSAAKICGGVGACVRDGAAYSCDCRGLATGSLCETCIDGKSASIDGKCVPLGCLTSNKQDLCTPTGTCVKSDGAYHCRCPDMLVAVDGKCTSLACTDEELSLVCSGHGTCDTSDLTAIKCTCNQDYTYVAPGRCILSNLIDNSNKVCSGNGRIVISADTPSTMECRCSSIYEGTKCEICNTTAAQEIKGECVAKKCIIEPSPNTRAATPNVCGDTGDYTTFGDPSNPFITCTPKDTSSGKVSAYNGTFFAKPGCVHVSKIDKTRRFYCGFLEGLTDALPTSGSPTCAVPSGQSGAAETCTECPTGFHLVHFGENNSTCMHTDCHNAKSSTHMWYDYCGGTGDCIKKTGQTGYACDCGAGATWNDTLKACVTDACKLDKKLAGPRAPEYCADVSSFELQCTVGRDATWQCDCSRGDYITYNRTCILKAKNADPTTQRVRGLCGGPGAGYLDSTGSCVCNAGFRKIGDLCYSYDCLPVGATAGATLSVDKYVCSGKGICAYNQLTGRYGCECESGYEAFGGYCTHSGCAGKVIHNGEIKYVECKVYDGTVGSCVQNANKNTYSCSCTFPYKPANGLCVHQRCMPGNVYCGGDALAACVKGSDYYYSCVCSEGYEKGQLYDECIPSKCVYRNSLSDPAVACNGLGTCSGEGSLLKNRECTCSSGATKYTLRDASGEMRNTCILDKCVSSGANTDAPVICGGLGRCGSNGCVCDMGTELLGSVCVSSKCIINTIDSNGKITKSICGGDTIGECKKVGSEANNLDYTCTCKQPQSDNYKIVDGFCLPNSCIFNIPRLDEGPGMDTMCGGRHFGSCVINTADSTKSYCECKRQDHIVQTTDKKCIKRDCLSDAVPGNTYKNVECSGHGQCATNNNINYSCKCEQGYKTAKGVIGTYLCIPQVCVVSETDTAMVCNGRGTCLIDEQKCSCHKEYTGEQCSDCADGYKRDANSRCYLNNCPTDENCGTIDGANAGSCQLVGSAFACVCANQNFVVDATSKQCRKSKCVWTDPYDHAEKTCYGMGTCSYSGATEQCSCNSGTTPIGTSVCAYAECMPNGNSDNPDMICKNRGTCTESPVAGKGMCQCDSSKYRTDKKSGQCFVKECFGAADSILSEVCDGGGTCDESTKKCNCNVDGFQSLSGQNGCAHTNCISSDKKLCSGFGACEKIGDKYGCLCASHYTLVEKDCVPTNCLNGTVTCNGGGTCTGVGASATCSCNSGWALRGTLCYPAACIANGLICGGNGDCPLSDSGSCNCRSGYESTSEELCISSRCVQRDADGTVQVCGGNGRCVSESGVKPSCVCNEGFSLTGDFICGVPAPSNKSSTGTTIAIVVVVLLVLAAVAGFLVWWFVIRPRKGGVIRGWAPRGGPGLPKPQLTRNSSLTASMYSTAPLLSGSRQSSMVQL